MSQKHKVETTLRDEDWEPFHAFLADRRTTIDMAVEWLAGHGYAMGRATVGNYVRSLSGRTMFTARPLFDVKDDADARKRITVWMRSLQGDELTMLLTFTAYLLNIASYRQRVALHNGPGLARIDPPART
jgi:hypothetical protein